MTWRGWLFAAGLVATTSPALAEGSVSGSATFRGQTLTLNQGLAWWDAEHNEARLALFDHTPPPGMLAALKADEWGEGGPQVTVRLRFESGQSPGLASVTYCYLDAGFPSGGTMGTNTDAQGCGVSVLGGDLRAGGAVDAKLAGQAEGPGEQPYAWDFKISLPIAR